MQLPYTTLPNDAVIAAQASLGAVLTAVLWFRPLRPWGATALMLTAIWLAIWAPNVEPSLLQSFGSELKPDHVIVLLKFSSLLALVAMLVARPRWIVVLALLAKLGLNEACDEIPDSNNELAALHVFAFAALLGVHQLVAPRSSIGIGAPERPRSYALHDSLVFAGATALGAIVCVFVLEKFCNSGDEWANTYQADLFAHLKSYTDVPTCALSHHNYWIFFFEGRAFAQYTPGWPLAMAPFQGLGIVWLASPVMFGLMAVAVARLGRRAAAGLSDRAVRASGTIAALLAMLGASMLLNAGSRFPHVFVCTCFAWAVESVSAMSAKGLSKRAQIAWGVALGSSTALMLSARPGDGLALGGAVFVYFVYAACRGRVGLRAFVALSLSFALWFGLTLVILRQQLGEWGRTGYDIAEAYWPAFAKTAFSLPKAAELKISVPFGTGSYCWWPCAPALGAAGLIGALRGPGRRVAAMLGLGALTLTALYFMAEHGRHSDSGYGPRFYLPLVVPMAVGGGLLVAPLWAAARARVSGRSALAIGGPAAVAVLALACGTLRIAPLIYPVAFKEVHARNAPLRAIAREKVHHAVVTVNWGEVLFDPLDLAQNLPSEPEPDVLVLVKRAGVVEQCARQKYPDRYWYKALGLEESELLPE